MKKVFTIAFVFFYLLGQAQFNGITVKSDGQFEFRYPWAGGMNSCQFGKVDLNLDTVDDLVVFDRTGDRIMPFLAVTKGNSMEYLYAPEFTELFPEIVHWAVFEDYNLDGKTDIFTYSAGYAGMKVYKNISENSLEFRLEVYPYLKSLQGGGYVNILVTYADYPAIADLDNDSDLDILTFYGLGSFVEQHQNLSMEKYGHADSLDFEQVAACWGYFAESEESNEITLDTCLSMKASASDGHADTRHTGSTFRIIDLNNDQLPDLLLGDVDFPNLIALYNGGDLETAKMVSYDWTYPGGSDALELFSMPAAFYDDFNFDGIRDLLVSPFDPNPFLPENFNSNWLYVNSGNDAQPLLNIQSKSFLQEQMLDFGAGAYPVFCDIDQDGLKDVLIGNYGYYDSSYYDQFLILHSLHTGKMAFLKNTGTPTQPAFTLAERDFAGISALAINGLVPAFMDLDGDGDPDLLLGKADGQLLHMENRGEDGFVPVTGNFAGIDVGSFSAPCLFDLDKDELDDLIIGEKGGNLNYFRNTGTIANPRFSFVTDSLGRINVTDENVSLDGYSVPCFYRDEPGTTNLLVGSEQGIIYHFTGIDGNLTGAFTQVDNIAQLIGMQHVPADFGARSAPALHDLDGDGFPELIAGNLSGGLNYFGKNMAIPVNRLSESIAFIKHNLSIFPNPADHFINITFQHKAETMISRISIFDILGRQYFSTDEKIPAEFSISVEQFPAGIYFIRMEGRQGSLTSVLSVY